MESKIRNKMLLLTLLPLLLLGIVSITVTATQFISYCNAESQAQLKDTAQTIYSVLDGMYPGDYAISENEEGRVLTKGEYTLNGRIELFDVLNRQTGLEYSLFFENTRVATTIENENGYIIGTNIADSIWNIFRNGAEDDYENVSINNESYVCYYLPIKNGANILVGIIGVAKPTSDIRARQLKIILPIAIVIIVLIVLTSFMILTYAKEISDCITSIREFVNAIANEKFNKRLSDKIYQREDELGDIGRDITIMRNILKDMVEQDSLTELYNKRTGNKRFEAIRHKCQSNGRPYALAIGDIDFFKKVNDTYGHDAGDEVLKEIAGIIKKKMKGSGFVARWGGEEFLIGFENKSKDKAVKILNTILNEIRKTTIEFNGMVIDVTMTFGIADGKEAKNLESLFKKADTRLYIGKENGRNQVVTEG